MRNEFDCNNLEPFGSIHYSEDTLVPKEVLPVLRMHLDGFGEAFGTLEQMSLQRTGVDDITERLARGSQIPSEQMIDSHGEVIHRHGLIMSRIAPDVEEMFRAVMAEQKTTQDQMLFAEQIRGFLPWVELCSGKGVVMHIPSEGQIVRKGRKTFFQDGSDIIDYTDSLEVNNYEGPSEQIEPGDLQDGYYANLIYPLNIRDFLGNSRFTWDLIVKFKIVSYSSQEIIERIADEGRNGLLTREKLWLMVEPTIMFDDGKDRVSIIESEDGNDPLGI